MIKKYCDIKYRDYTLEVERKEYIPGKFHYCGRSNNKILFYDGIYSFVHHLNRFMRAVDEILGEREKEEEILFCSIVYKEYELEIFLKEDLNYLAWITNFDFTSWGIWGEERLVEIIEAFREKVDSGRGENLIHSICNHNGSTLVVRKKGELYTGESFINGRDWWQQSYDLDFLVRWFKSDVDEFLSEEEFFFHYKGYDLTAKRKEEGGEWYVGTSKIGNENWTQEGYKLKNLIRCFEYCVDCYLNEQSELYEYF